MIGDVDAWWSSSCDTVVSDHRHACEQEVRTALPGSAGYECYHRRNLLSGTQSGSDGSKTEGHANREGDDNLLRMFLNLRR